MKAYFNNRVKQANMWDIAALKVYVLLIGLVIGAYFSNFIKENVTVFIIGIIVFLFIVMYGFFFRKSK